MFIVPSVSGTISFVLMKNSQLTVDIYIYRKNIYLLEIVKFNKILC